MKITIETNSKEIADLVLKLQNRQSVEKTVEVALFPNPKELLKQSINAVLHEKSHDTSEEKQD